VAHIIHTNLDFQEFLREVVEELGISVQSRQKWDLLKALNQFLIEMYSQNRKVVLIIDEAQNLDPQVLEGIRMLSNLETPKDKLIQIVFIGQPGLIDHILRPDMIQLKQRIAGYYVLGPLSCKETEDYVAFRMGRVQSKPSLRFTPQALQLIFEWSGGIPRLINILCDLSLLHAFLADSWTVDQSLVRKAVMDLKGPGEETEKPSHGIGRIKDKDNQGTLALPETGSLPPLRAADLSTEDRGQDFVPDLLFPIEKSSMRKKIALALGGFLILCGLGFYFLGERIGSEYWSTRADSPVYQISIPIDDLSEGLPAKPSSFSKKLSRINPETGY
jgi:hypothetical protein